MFIDLALGLSSSMLALLLTAFYYGQPLLQLGESE